MDNTAAARRRKTAVDVRPPGHPAGAAVAVLDTVSGVPDQQDRPSGTAGMDVDTPSLRSPSAYAFDSQLPWGQYASVTGAAPFVFSSMPAPQPHGSNLPGSSAVAAAIPAGGDGPQLQLFEPAVSGAAAPDDISQATSAASKPFSFLQLLGDDTADPDTSQPTPAAAAAAAPAAAAAVPEAAAVPDAAWEPEDKYEEDEQAEDEEDEEYEAHMRTMEEVRAETARVKEEIARLDAEKAQMLQEQEELEEMEAAADIELMLEHLGRMFGTQQPDELLAAVQGSVQQRYRPDGSENSDGRAALATLKEESGLSFEELQSVVPLVLRAFTGRDPTAPLLPDHDVGED